MTLDTATAVEPASAVQASAVAESRKKAPAWALFLYEVTERLLEFGGGPRIATLQWAVNFHKIVTAFLIYGMMVHYDNYSMAAWVFLGLHGTYGYTWLIKDLAFPNAAFVKQRLTIFGIAYLYGGLIAWYWLMPWLLISRHIEPTGVVVFLAVAIHTLGVTLMATADVQKNLTMRFRKGLFTDGVCTYTRNPNYLGEIMIYGAYALLASHWLAWAILAYACVFMFLPRMLVKDASISRHPGWAVYKARSGLLIPWAFFNGRAFADLWRGRAD
jgi:protein-S-isoprenylcysteine O-methyltransferase Ste14